MTNTPLVTRLDDHVQNAALALDMASTALIRAQELADQDTTGTAPAHLAQAKAMLRGNLRMLADMLKPPQVSGTAGGASPTAIAGAGISRSAPKARTRLLKVPAQEPKRRRQHGRA
jgi:hypothetical protein